MMQRCILFTGKIYGYFLLLMVGCVFQSAKSSEPCKDNVPRCSTDLIFCGIRENAQRCRKTCGKCVPEDKSTWGSWSFSSCSRSCGGGARSGSRFCVGGGRCPGSRTKAELCNTQTCPGTGASTRIKFKIVRITIPRGWRKATAVEVEMYRSTVTPIIMLNIKRIFSLEDGCVYKVDANFKISTEIKCDYSSDYLILKIPPCSNEERRGCDEKASCTKTLTSYKCTCNAGYQGDGRICRDINECFPKVGVLRNCPWCINTQGSYNCKCNRGYSWDGTRCADINECAQKNKCDFYATCVNFDGSYTCTCDATFEGDGYTCSKKVKKTKAVSNVIIVVIVVILIIVAIIAGLVIKNRRQRQRKLEREREEREQARIRLLEQQERELAAEAAERNAIAERQLAEEGTTDLADRGISGSPEINLAEPPEGTTYRYQEPAPSAPPLDDYIPEADYPEDSKISDLSDAPPTYRKVFPSGYNPATTDETLPPPPAYDEAVNFE